MISLETKETKGNIPSQTYNNVFFALLLSNFLGVYIGLLLAVGNYSRQAIYSDFWGTTLVVLLSCIIGPGLMIFILINLYVIDIEYLQRFKYNYWGCIVFFISALVFSFLINKMF